MKTAHTRLRTARLELERRLRQLRAIGGPRADTARELSSLGPGPPAPSRRTGIAMSAERRRRLLGRARALAPLPLFRRIGGDGAAWFARALGAGAVAAGLAMLVHQGGDRGASRAAMAPEPRARSVSTAPLPPRWTEAMPRPSPAAPAPLGDDGPPSPAGDPGRLPGLVAHFTFDEPPGSLTTRDRSGLGNECAIRGRTPPRGVDWAAGLRGRAVDLNGYGWLECPSQPALGRLRGQLTIAAWVKRTGEREHIRSLVTWHYRPESLDYFQFGFRHERLFLRTGVDVPTVTAPSAPPRGRWAHVALTVAADGTARFFVDGTAIHRAAIAPRAHLGSTAYPMLIGAVGNRLNPTRAHEVVQALVDDVVLYDRVLDDPEIATLAAVASPGMASAERDHGHAFRLSR